MRFICTFVDIEFVNILKDVILESLWTLDMLFRINANK